LLRTNIIWYICKLQLYDNEYTSIINIYFYETFSTRTMSISILKTFLHTLSDIIDNCIHFSLIKIEPVSIFPSQATLGPILSSVVYTFRLKMLPLVLIKNCNSCVCWIIFLSNKLDLNQETHFTIQQIKIWNCRNLCNVLGI
jgi:hypothetical protein